MTGHRWPNLLRYSLPDVFLVFQREASLEAYIPEYVGDSFWFSAPNMFIRINRKFLTLIHIKNDHGLLICLLLIRSLYGKEHITELPVPLTIILLSAVITSLYTNTGAKIKLQNVRTVARKDKQNHHQQKNKSLFSGTCSAKHVQKVLDAYASRSLKLI